jgi:hypothetical protein
MAPDDALQPPPLPAAATTSGAADFPSPLAISKPRNTLGTIALVTLVVVTLLTPIGICGVPLLVLIPIGLLGGLLALISLFKAPRWPGLTALLLLIICIILWVFTAIGLVVFGSKLAEQIKKQINRELDRTQARMNQRDNSPSGPPPTPDQIAALSAASSALAAAAEAQRKPDGSAPTFINLSAGAGVAPQHQVDPWGFPYKYHLSDSSRGYTFRSNGPDGIADTQDDIDLFDLATSIRKRGKR